MKIEEILAQRTDLSQFLVHLTRAKDDGQAIDNLISILREHTIKAFNPFGMAVTKLEKNNSVNIETQKTVCFSETPLEHVKLLTGKIEGRICNFSPYGIAIKRKEGRKAGVNPVWYIDNTIGHNWLTTHVNTLLDSALESEDFANEPILKLTPFFEQMGSKKAGIEDWEKPYKKEFWWEREWRKLGDFDLPNRYIILCPAADISKIKEVIGGLDCFSCPNEVCYIDAGWNSEEIKKNLSPYFKHIEL